MPIEDIHVTIALPAPGADSTERTLYDSSVACPGVFKSFGLNRVVFSHANTQPETLNVYFSKDGGATWSLNYTVSIAANTGITGSPYDDVIIGFDDVKVTLTNGGSAQTVWPPSLAFVRGQKASSA
jgi:hypothetical protein